MTNLEAFEHYKSEWEAKRDRAKSSGNISGYTSAVDVVYGMDLALTIFKGPLNKVNAHGQPRPFDHVCHNCGAGIYLNDYDATVCGCQ